MPKNSLPHRILKLTTYTVALFAAMPQRFTAALPAATCVAPQDFVVSNLPMCTPRDGAFYADLVAELTSTAWYPSAQAFDVDHLKDIVKQKFLRSTIQEKGLVTLALHADYPIINFLQQQKFSAKKLTLVNLLKQWHTHKENDPYNVGIEQQFIFAYQLLEAQLPEKQFLHNAQIMNAAVKTKNEFVVQRLLADGYDLHIVDSESGQLPAYNAMQLEKFNILELFLKHGFDPAESADEKMSYHFLRLLKHRLDIFEEQNNLKFLIALTQSQYKNNFLNTLAQHPDAGHLISQLKSLTERSILANFSFLMQMRMYMLKHPELLLALGFTLITLAGFSVSLEKFLLLHLGKRIARHHVVMAHQKVIQKEHPKIVKPKDPIKEKILHAKHLREAANKSICNRLTRWVKTYTQPQNSHADIHAQEASVIESENHDSHQVDVVVNNKKQMTYYKPKKSDVVLVAKRASKLQPMRFIAKHAVNIEDLAEYQAQANQLESVRVTPENSVAESVEVKPVEIQQRFTTMHVNIALLPVEAQIVFNIAHAPNSMTLLNGGSLRDLVTGMVYNVHEDPRKLNDLDFVTDQNLATLKFKFLSSHLINKPNFKLLKAQVGFRSIDIFQSESFVKRESFETALLKDAASRPFRIDKLYARIVNNQWEIIDVTGHAFEDIIARRLVMDEDPDRVLTKDPLIILRAIYYAQEKCFTIDEKLLAAIERHKLKVIDIIPARLKEFILKFATAKYAVDILLEFDKLGISKFIWNKACQISGLSELLAPIRFLADQRVQFQQSQSSAALFFTPPEVALGREQKSESGFRI